MSPLEIWNSIHPLHKVLTVAPFALAWMIYVITHIDEFELEP